jgi:hypothetical protein
LFLILFRQVPAADAEKLAKKEGLLFFEVCAKTNQNILQMFYSAVVELPFFEQFEINNKQALIEQISKYIIIKLTFLVNENQGEVENSILEMVNKGTPNKGLEIKGSKPTPGEQKSNCKC